MSKIADKLQFDDYAYRTDKNPTATDLSYDCVIEITPDEKSYLEVLSAQLGLDPYKETRAFLGEAALMGQEIPRRIRRRVMDFKENSNDEGVLVIKGLPEDRDLPDTPSEPLDPFDRHIKTTFVSEIWLAAFGGLLGEAVAYAQEKKGSVFHNIYPTPGNEEKQTNESSKIFLEWHTELTFLYDLAQPDYVELYCLRQDHEKKAKTLFASIGNIKKCLTPKQQEILFRKEFCTGIDYSWGVEKGKGPQLLLPVLYGDPSYPCMTYDSDLMRGATEEANKVLEVMKTLINNNSKGVCLEPGDLLIIDNQRSVHGRSYFEPRYDGKDRWLQRMLVVRDLTRLVMHMRRGERIVHPML